MIRAGSIARIRIATWAALLLVGAAQPVRAEILPSTGADGPLHVTANQTLALPPDGIFNFTTVTIDAPGPPLTDVLTCDTRFRNPLGGGKCSPALSFSNRERAIPAGRATSRLGRPHT